MNPIEKIAARFIRDRNLTPPIDIRQVVLGLANIDEVDFPGSADAILLSANSKRDKPLILLRKSNSAVRKVFTLAHELGHIIIPWHAGTFICHTDLHITVPNHIYLETEVEANRFASEVLMPSAWVQNLVKSEATVVAMIESLQSSGVSALAASLALCRHLPPGYIFAEVSQDGEIGVSARSPNTFLDQPIRGTQIRSLDFLSLVQPPEMIRVSGGSILWWKTRELQRREVAPELVDSRTILNSILRDISDDAGIRTKVLQSVNGIIGVANFRAQQSKSDIYSVLKARFVGRENLRSVIEHNLFDSFLIRKTEELEKRAQSSR